MAEGTHIGPLGAAHPQQELVRAQLVLQLQGVDGHRAGGALHLPALPGQVIELLSVDLDGGVHGGHLLDVPPELGQNGQQILRRADEGGLPDDLSGDVLGVGDNAQF